MVQRGWPQGRVQGAWRKLEPGHSRVALRPRGLQRQALPQAPEGRELRRNIQTRCCREPQSPRPPHPLSRPSLALHPPWLQGGNPSQSRGPGNAACVKCPRAPSRRPAGQPQGSIEDRRRGRRPALQAAGRASRRSRRRPGNSRCFCRGREAGGWLRGPESPGPPWWLCRDGWTWAVAWRHWPLPSSMRTLAWPRRPMPG